MCPLNETTSYLFHKGIICILSNFWISRSRDLHKSKVNTSLDKAKEIPVGKQKHIEGRAAASDFHMEGNGNMASVKVINSLFL